MRWEAKGHSKWVEATVSRLRRRYDISGLREFSKDHVACRIKVESSPPRSQVLEDLIETFGGRDSLGDKIAHAQRQYREEV